ncbi:TSUP family transporter [Tsuneonella sp. CC-YZS046]|uniref:TSUP family transporter n=1 Tax=Tsuneonella sp. CC-YZS046 TaxID=3042152 RepID=UPI002D78515F|nr:TSUP family transporter [Tsuneonella sp. CC-YZS046]WRO67633.1 TSUP family transporter [Tsuneonella sp. CC-YZS046]
MDDAPMELEPWIYAALVATGILTGFIDAIAGGGGLIMMPALLSAGLPPHLALGTNKLQSTMGVAMATWTYHGKGLLDIRANWPLVLCVLVASAAGSLAVQALDPDVLQLVVPVLLMLCAAYVLLSPRMDDHDRHHRLSRHAYAPVTGSIGFYDGFFGPGTGSFFTTSLVALRGMGLTRATALAKLFNFTSNFGALLMFILGGKVIWMLGIAIGLGCMAGSWLGSHSAIRYGARLIRPLLVVISLGLTARLLWGYFSG